MIHLSLMFSKKFNRDLFQKESDRSINNSKNDLFYSRGRVRNLRGDLMPNLPKDGILPARIVAEALKNLS